MEIEQASEGAPDYSVVFVCLIESYLGAGLGQRTLRQANGRDNCLGWFLRFSGIQVRNFKVEVQRVATANCGGGGGRACLPPHSSRFDHLPFNSGRLRNGTSI